MIIEPRWFQEEAVDALFNFYSTPRALDEKGKPVPKNAVVCLPTGTGKSVVIALFLLRAFQTIPSTRAIMSTHVKELIEQNAERLLQAWPLAPLGVFSAGLGQRDLIQPIIFGGIKSMVGKLLFGRRDFLVIDEAHLVGNEGQYLQFINELQTENPYLKIIMLTATPYRLGMGCLTNGKIATDIVYNLCTIDGFTRLIAEGYLCPLIPKKMKTELDVSNVGINALGDFNAGELQETVDKYDVNYRALLEVVEHGYDRRSWLLFAAGVEHAEHLGDILNTTFGVPTVVIHSKKSDKQNKAALDAWKAGEVRAAVNMNALTTGVDHPACDMIGVLRPTMSPGLWVQMLGRGTRPFAGKNNCLVLDFAGNTRRLGPINDPVIPRPKGKGLPGVAPVRICKICASYNHARATSCVVCGTSFETGPNIDDHASTAELIRSDLPQFEEFKVDRVVYSTHVTKATKTANPDMPVSQLPFLIKASYFCGLRTFYEFVSVEGSNYARKQGRDWFRQRHANEPPETNAEVLMYMSQLRAPERIRVWINTKYPKVMGYEF